jgi:protein TonB
MSLDATVIRGHHVVALALTIAVHVLAFCLLGRTLMRPEHALDVPTFVSIVSVDTAAPADATAPPLPRIEPDIAIPPPRFEVDATTAITLAPSAPASVADTLAATASAAGEPHATPPVTASVDDLAVICPVRTAPRYPPQSRHLREQGEVTLRVEIDERGLVGAVDVIKSSGYARLDAAARAALLTWRCNPALRDGMPVRAIAIQRLEFVLERR